MTLSERHHYLPQFYIKGFVGKDGKVAVFNKEKGKIDKIRKSPKQIFYENNRNTFEIDGKKTDFIEKLHTFGENQFAPTHKKIIENLENINLTGYDVFQIMLFIATIYRRIPEQDQNAIEYVKNLTQNNSFIVFRNKETGEDASEDFFKKMIDKPFFTESSKIIRSMEDYFKTNRVETAKNWKLSYAPEGSNPLSLLSDNPLIIERTSEKGILDSISIFPLSKGIIVYNTCEKEIKQVSNFNIVYIDVLTFIQAEKLVCGPDAEYLKKISELAKEYDTDRKIELLKGEVFKIFE
jgi:hypothetical protein